MGGSATGLITVYMRDGAGPGTPTGTISAVFTTGSRLAMHSSGGTVVLFATSGHEHGITQAEIVQINPSGASAYTSTLGTILMYAGPIDLMGQTATASTSITVDGTGKRSIAVNGGFSVFKGGGAAGTYNIRIFRDTTTIASGQFTVGAVAGTGGGRLVSTGTIDPTLATGAYTYAVSFDTTGNTATSVWLAGAFIDVQEISVP